MWRILTILQKVFILARDVDEIREHIRALNDKVHALTSDVQSLSEKIEANAEHQAAERKALICGLKTSCSRLISTLDYSRAQEKLGAAKNHNSER